MKTTLTILLYTWRISITVLVIFLVAYGGQTNIRIDRLSAWLERATGEIMKQGDELERLDARQEGTIKALNTIAKNHGEWILKLERYISENNSRKD